MGCQINNTTSPPIFTKQYLLPIKKKIRQKKGQQIISDSVSSNAKIFEWQQKKKQSNLQKVGVLSSRQKQLGYCNKENLNEQQVEQNNKNLRQGNPPHKIVINYIPKQLNENVLYFKQKLVFLEEQNRTQMFDKQKILNILKQQKISVAQFVSIDRSKFLSTVKAKQLANITKKKDAIVNQFINNQVLQIKVNDYFYKTQPNLFESD